MQFPEMFKRKMIQKLAGPNAISATALSKQIDVSQATLSRWLREAGVEPTVASFNNTDHNPKTGLIMPQRRPEDWNPEEKLTAVLEAASLSEDQLGAFLRDKGLHETYLQQWRMRMLSGLGKTPKAKKTKRSSADAKRIRSLEKELKRKDKALAETAALLILKKKALEIWGDEDDDTARRNGK